MLLLSELLPGYTLQDLVSLSLQLLWSYFHVCLLRLEDPLVSAVAKTEVVAHTKYNYLYIMKTRLYDFDPPQTPLLYSKWGLQGYILFFLFLLKNIDCGYSLEPPHQGGSTEYPQSMF